MSNLRYGVIGTGFWSFFQISGWKEVGGAICAAVCDLDQERARAIASRLDIPAVYPSAEAMLDREELDFVDIITGVDSHSRIVRLAAGRNLPVICQKPLASTLEEARQTVDFCRERNVPLFVHENWRWQSPIRALKRLMQEVPLGRVFRGRLVYSNSFPVFENQPFLKELEQFILTDMGTHVLDVFRFLFGEASSVYCQVQRTRDDIKGENAATLLMKTREGASVSCELGYAGYPNNDRFPELFVSIEGSNGALELGPDYWIHVSTPEERYAQRFPPPDYEWALPDYSLVHSSIVDCSANLLAAIQGEAAAETTGEDNLKTLELVFAAYRSAGEDAVVALESGSADPEH